MTTNDYTKVGMAAMLSGMQHLADLVNSELARFKAQAGLQRWDRPVPEAKPKSAKPHRKREPKKKMMPYWAAMTAKERSEEMRRRIAMGKERKVNGAVAQPPAADPLHQAISEIRQIEWKES